MTMSKQLRGILTYIKMITLFTVLGAIVLFIGGAQIAAYIIGTGSMLIYNGAPVDLNAKRSDISLLLEEGNNLAQSEGRVVVEAVRIGTVECERIALSAPLYEGDSSAILLKGAGHYPESALPGSGKVILISAHDSTFFAPLERIAIGDVIKIVMEDKDYYYGIAYIRVADKEDNTAYDLSSEKERLILYTCYPFGQFLGIRNERYFVYGEPLSAAEVLQEERADEDE